MKYSIGLRDGSFAGLHETVVLATDPSSFGYADGLIAKGRVKLQKGYKGKIVGIASTGKVAVEFDEKVWIDPEFGSTNDCHGKGKVNHCMYIPPHCLIKASDFDYLNDPEYQKNKKLDDEVCQLTYQADQRLLLLIQ